MRQLIPAVRTYLSGESSDKPLFMYVPEMADLDWKLTDAGVWDSFTVDNGDARPPEMPPGVPHPHGT